MKLKLLVVASMSIGLISGTVFAADAAMSSDAAATTATATDSSTDATAATSAPVVKHKHRKKARHKAHHVAQTHDYKEMGALVQPAPQVDNHDVIYNAMGQNSNRGQAMPDWFNRIGVSGGVNFDAHWGNRSQNYQGENTQRLALNDGYLNAMANVNDWSKAFMSLSYNNASATYSSAYPTAVSNNQLGLNLEQGYITIANYNEYPIFLQVGKQYTDFGRYTIHPLTRTMTQVLSESLATSAKLGFITNMGLHGQVYAFDNAINQTSVGHSKSVYGAALGFDQPNDQLGYDVGVGYMSNMTGVNDVANVFGNGFSPATYTHLVGAVAVYGDVNSGPFSLSARYTTAIQRFSPNDISTQMNQVGSNLSGARPWAADFTAGYGFNALSKNQNVYIGYQTSNNAVSLTLPKSRYIVGYGVDMWKNTSLGLEIDHDKAYSSGNSGTGKTSNLIGARASVKFG